MLMKHPYKTIYNLGILALWTVCTLLSGCSSEKPTHLEPRLATLAATDITRTSATLHGTATVEGDTDMPKLLFRYGDTETMPLSTVEVEPHGAEVDLPISGLTAGTTYYYILQGSNGRTSTTSNTTTFTTQPNANPKVASLTLLSHGPTSAIVNYDITDDGGEQVSETGCYVCLASDPTNKQKYTAENLDGKAGTQKLRIGGLQRNASYQVAAFAKNSIGETVGESISYTTTEAILLNEAGELSELMGESIYDHTSLSIAGPMNGDDLSCLRKMMGRNPDNTATPGKLTDIDMTDVRIVTGGGPYNASRYTQDHVIGQGLFAYCDQLTHVVLPADATTLEKDAFSHCISLRKIEIAAGLNSVLPSSDCPAMETITVSPANANYSSQDGVLLNSKGTQIVWFPMGKTGEYTLPSTITSVGDYAFRQSNIETFCFPDNLTDIGQGAFMDSKVREVKLPDCLRLVATGTFQGCSQLKVVRLGTQTERICAYAFDGCPLTDLYIASPHPPTCEENAFATKTASYLTTCVLHVPKGQKKTYEYHKEWGKFAHIVEDSSL